MLELDKIQGLVVRSYNLDFARYLFLNFKTPQQGKQWSQEIAKEITTANSPTETAKTCLNVAFTYNGLKALGLSASSLAAFPEAFQQGIAQRAEILGDTEQSSPESWQGGLGTPQVHAILLLFAHNAEELEAHSSRHRSILQQIGNIEELSAQEAARLPGRREHFGFSDGNSQPAIEGSGIPAICGQPVIKAGEFILGYPDQTKRVPDFPKPEVLGRNGSFLVYRKLYQDVAGFWQFMREQSSSAEETEWLAAKSVGRWRSGAPLVLSPHGDDPALGNNPRKNNDFMYADSDPRGFACPLGAHIRRANPRDSLAGFSPHEALEEVNRHLMIRRGMAYGSRLAPAEPDDGADRGLTFICLVASISRQFEFVQQTWLNNRKFHNLPDDKDPIAGDNDGTCKMRIQREPFRMRITGLPRFVTVKGGGYFFLPGIDALRFLASES